MDTTYEDNKVYIRSFKEIVPNTAAEENRMSIKKASTVKTLDDL